MELITVSIISISYNIFKDLGCWIVTYYDESYKPNAPYMPPEAKRESTVNG